MTPTIRPSLSHLGIFVKDIESMVDFYTTVFGLLETDRGTGAVFKNSLVFLSGNPAQHHQLVLSSGRPQGSKSTVMQISFTVPDLAALKATTAKAMENGATDMVGLNHGNAWSVYFDDPENNKVEVYVDTPFHTPQPCGEPLNLDLSEADLLAETKALVDALPEGQSREAYIQTMADRFSS